MTEQVRHWLDELSTEEKIALVTGKDFFTTQEIPRLGIPSIALSDGPHGVRAQEAGKGDHLGIGASAAATCFPSGAAIASSWNTELVGEVARAIGEEARYYNVRTLLGPAFNIKRSPLCGRSFEYYSEDPYLSGKLAAAYISAIQTIGVAACPKHFACNNQEDRRMVSNSVMDERTLHEIYLAPFELAVKEGKPWSIMSAYNKVNGTFASEHKKLLTDILRHEWGFDGVVLSDWGAVSDRVKSAIAGLDLEMPGTFGYSAQLLRDALADGSLTTDELDACVENILTLITRTDQAQSMEEIDFTGHHALAQRAAEECIILLKNEHSALPLEKGGKIALIGALARQPRYQGGGSSHVASWKVDNTLECIRAIGGALPYCAGYRLDDGDTLDEALLAEAAALAQSAETVVVFVGLTGQYETEGSDRPDMKLPPAHNELVRRVRAVNDNVVVVLTAGAPVELPWVNEVTAILSTYTAGDGLGRALARILFGEAVPSGKLTETMPVCLEHTPAYLNFREDKTDIRYGEGVFVGYRWYEKRNLPVLFPFGHGLSYTSFAYSGLTVEQAGTESFTVTARVTNTGAVPGKECVQLYVADLESSVPRPMQELKGFAKVVLEPGETKTVTFPLDRRSFAFYDIHTNDWTVEPGCFELRVGASSADIRLRQVVEIHGALKKQLEQVTPETTYGELVDDPRTYPLICEFLRQSPMYRPAEMPDAPDFLRNLPLWTLNHMAGHPISPDDLDAIIFRLNQTMKSKIARGIQE